MSTLYRRIGELDARQWITSQAPEAYRGHVWNPEHMTGSNVPARSRGPSMPTGPVVSVSTVLDRVSASRAAAPHTPKSTR
ncbi:MAG: hypothetical protein JWO49_881 [Arthrobacter sp.]|nr:hypothetical protein [Arthrobacter sp.]